MSTPKKNTDVELGSVVLLNGGKEIPFHEVVTLKPVLPWRTQDVRDVRVIGYLLRIAANMECTQSWRKKCDAVIRAE